jgi:hypothetical protein
MGLLQADTIAIKAEYDQTIAEVRARIVEAEGFNWQMFVVTTDLPLNSAACMAYFATQCNPAESSNNRRALQPWVYQWTDPRSGSNLPHVQEDLAIFLLARGDYAWIGYSWIGCTSGNSTASAEQMYYRPPEVEVDYGTPVDDAVCSELSTGETGGGGSGIFSREYTHARVSFDCNTMTSEIRMKEFVQF